MSVSNRIGSILIEGIYRIAAFNTSGTKGLAGELDEVVDFTLSDEQEKAEKRAGYQNPIIYQKYGNRTITITATNGTLSTSLLKLYTGQDTVVKTSVMPKREKGVVVSSGTATLEKTPKAGTPMTVYTTDGYGRNLLQLTPTSSTVTPTTYKIVDGAITVDSSVTNPLNVWYSYEEEIEEVSGKGGVSNVYSLDIDCIWHDTTTNLKYNGVITVNNASLSPSYNIAGKNSNDVPDDQTVEFTVLSKMGEEPYTIKFAEIVAE